MSEKFSSTVTVGHKASRDGGAAVFLALEDGASSAALTPSGARLVAAQILDWADHAETWHGLPEAEKEQVWLTWTNPPVVTQTALVTQSIVKATEDPAPV